MNDPRTEGPEFSTFTKDDSGKQRWSLIYWPIMFEVVDVLEAGAKDYGAHNWKECPKEEEDRYFDAAMRHIMAWRIGGKKDPKTGIHHLCHAICCLLFLRYFDGKR